MAQESINAVEKWGCNGLKQGAFSFLSEVVTITFYFAALQGSSLEGASALTLRQ